MKIQNQKKVWNKISEEWANYRTRPLEIVEKFLKNKKGNILDLGCGSGRNMIKKKNTKFYGIDISQKMIKQSKSSAEKKGINYELKVSKANKIPYPKSFFDSAIYIATLHCLTTKNKRLKSLKELNRVLKPNAEALISVWGWNQNRIKNKPKESLIPWTVKSKKHYRFNYIYEIDELLNEINLSGLKFVKIWEDKNINVIVKKL
jgi:ubiquinone/menaquinone biosynthesis C-methylase UbiE